MQGSITLIKRLAWIIVFAALLSGALVQADRLKAPKIITEMTNQYWSYPNVVELFFTHVEGEAGIEVWIKGPREWKPKRQGGWHPVSHFSTEERFEHGHQFVGLMPGNTYTFRVRAVDKDGQKGKASKPFKFQMMPCWVFNRHWKSGNEYWWDKGGPMPKKWAIKNTKNCNGVKIRK